MCGIFGAAGKDLPDEAVMRKALDMLAHRGPDQAGWYCDTESGYKLWMGHRRLSILDLSEAGKQPFVTPDRKVAISVNGEIYNHMELRGTLETKGAVFRSHSDSEVLLWGFYYDGEAFFRKIRGIYAAAIWDRRSETSRLLLLRDRLGIKPLYYHFRNEQLEYASELKAITALPGWGEEVDPCALSHYLALRYIPSPLTIYENTYKVSPGEYVVWECGKIHRQKYWDITIPEQKFSGTLDDAADELDHLLNESVKEQMMSDVPLGAFLSGGIDSSLICAILQRQLGSCRLKTFTIGFETKQEDESSYAQEIADFLGTEHYCKRMTGKDALSIVPKLPSLYDEPYGDDSAFPTYLLSGVAKKQVTTVLSGDGGDELFFGYNNVPRLWKFGLLNEYVPRFLRQLGGIFLYTVFQESRLGKAGRAISFDEIDEPYLMFSGVYCKHLFRKLTGHDLSFADSILRRTWNKWKNQVSPCFAAPFLDMELYLPDDICCKVDRASMAHALEVRPPLLDHRIVEFANSLPFDYKYTRNQGGKIVLKKVLERYMPRNLWERPKQGFSTPAGNWFRKELRAQTEKLLSPETLSLEWDFQPSFVTELLEDHFSGKKNLQYHLWVLFALEQWKMSISTGSFVEKSKIIV